MFGHFDHGNGLTSNVFWVRTIGNLSQTLVFVRFYTSAGCRRPRGRTCDTSTSRGVAWRVWSPSGLVTGECIHGRLPPCPRLSACSLLMNPASAASLMYSTAFALFLLCPFS